MPDQDQHSEANTESEVESSTPTHFFDPVYIERYYDAQREKDENKYTEIATSDEYPSILTEALSHYNDVGEFATGDLVQWKPMMRNRRLPLESVPAIVVRAINPPHTTDREGNRSVEPCDLLIAVVDGDQDFLLFEVSSRRLTEWKQ